jgi:uncharacterized phage protein gp47/JayE
MSSTYRDKKSEDDVFDLISNYLQKGYVQVELEEITFEQGTTQYTLANGNLVSIISIEGIDNDGNSVPPEGSFNGVSALLENTDYTLTRTAVETDPFGVDLYDTITFTDPNQFVDSSTVYITYIYYDSVRVSRLTNFSNGSVNALIARAFSVQLSNLYNINERAYNAGFVTLATGTDLDNHAEFWGLTRDTGTFASGSVQVSVASGADDFTVTNNTAFVAAVAGENIIFNATVGGTVAADSTVQFDVEAIAVGYKYNVGANSITRIYQDNTLGNLITGATVTNPVIKLNGSLNTFQGGSDAESDTALRQRILRQSAKLGRGTEPAIEAALEDLDTVSDARILYDKENDIVYITAVSNIGAKLLTDTSSIATLNETIIDYAPVNATYVIQHPVPIMIKFSGTVNLLEDDYNNRSVITYAVSGVIDEYIQNLGIGKDILYSEMIKRAMQINGVFDFNIGEVFYSEFASNPIAFDDNVVKLTTNSGVNVAYQEFRFVPTGRVDTVVYSGSATFTTDYSEVVNSPTPYVYLAIDDGTGNWIRNPAYLVDWYTSNTETSITLDENAGSGVGRTLVSGVDSLNLYYHSASTTHINGFRVKLYGGFVSGTVSSDVEWAIYSGTTSPDTAQLLKSGTITVLSGSADYEVEFASPLIVADPEVDHYLAFSGIGTVSGTEYVGLPTSASGTLGSINTKIYSGSVADIVAGSMTLVPNKIGMLHTLLIQSGVENIVVEDSGYNPDVPVIYSVNIGYNLVVVQ